MRGSSAIALTLVAGIASLSHVNGDVYSIHGSGTTNPSKCIWHIMSLFEERAQISTRLTYRAVGSSTGQLEFLGKENNSTKFNSHVPHNYFGAGDIPIPKEDYDALHDAMGEGKHMVHLPFAMSSVSFFHNIPGVPLGKGGIKLNACVLARIFNGEIQKWDDPSILEDNDHIKDVLKGTIFVARRVQGSSSTKSITKFLNTKCANEWPDDMVGSKLDGKWHATTHPCEGSAGMTACVKDNAGSIGYMDSGHGWSEELAEVNVRNEDGFYVTSKHAHENGGITYAAEEALTPKHADDDWSHVHFLNKPGRNTWPIVVMSYVYVRKDVHNFITIEEERGLLKLFLDALYMEEYFGNCKKLGFSGPPKKVREMAQSGIESISWEFSDTYGGKNMWEFEFDTRKIAGMGKWVISAKRRSLAGVSIEDLAGAEKKMKGNIAYAIETLNALFTSETSEFKTMNGQLNSQEAKIEAALVLSALSFTLWACLIVGWLVKRLCLLRK